MQEEVFCTSYVAAHYLKNSLRLQGKVYLIGMSGFAHELGLQGLPFTGPGVREASPCSSVWSICLYRRILCVGPLLIC